MKIQGFFFYHKENMKQKENLCESSSLWFAWGALPEDTQPESPSTHKALGEQSKGVFYIAPANEEVICLKESYI